MSSIMNNKKILFHCDNEAVVHILNILTSKNERVMCIIRILTLKCLQINAVIKAVHVKGVNNNICDALSRFQWSRFRQLVPDADPDPAPMPARLWGIFKTELSDWFKQA